MDQLRADYEVERELADRLRHAHRPERSMLYSQVYDELFRRVPNHPQWTKRGTDRREVGIASQVRLIEPHLIPENTFLEVGAGDCALSQRIAPLVRKAYGLEVSAELTHGIQNTARFELLVADTCDIPLPDNSIDFAFSFQLIEHIHPEDVIDSMREIHRVLKPGGIYYCVTPNRLSGPHDISRYFSRDASGLHLKEYSIRDLVKLYRNTGFERVWIERRIKSVRWTTPVFLLEALESVLESMPWSVRAPLARSFLLSRLLDVAVLGAKAPGRL